MKRVKALKRLIQPNTKNHVELPVNAIDVLLVMAKDGEGRVAMTISCRDTDYIPKVKDAGKIQDRNGQKIQVMHNGMVVTAGGYWGDWMTKIIKNLKGHHEPQEEKIFYEIIKKLRKGSTMIELGSFWSYYSLWFHTEIKDAVNICCEPDENNLEVGKQNAKLNSANNIVYCKAAAGSKDGTEVELAMDSDPNTTKKVIVRSVDSLVKEYNIEYLDLLHMDIQGFELDALHGAIETIRAGKLRFLIVSTHHYLFSKDPLTHQNCIDFIKENGGHIIASHTVPESFSGDGLIAASFSEKDAAMTVDVSINHTDDSLFRPYEQDMAILIDAYNLAAKDQ